MDCDDLINCLKKSVRHFKCEQVFLENHIDEEAFCCISKKMFEEELHITDTKLVKHLIKHAKMLYEDKPAKSIKYIDDSNSQEFTEILGKEKSDLKQYASTLIEKNITLSIARKMSLSDFKNELSIHSLGHRLAIRRIVSAIELNPGDAGNIPQGDPVFLRCSYCQNKLINDFTPRAAPRDIELGDFSNENNLIVTNDDRLRIHRKGEREYNQSVTKQPTTEVSILRTKCKGCSQPLGENLYVRIDRVVFYGKAYKKITDLPIYNELLKSNRNKVLPRYEYEFKTPNVSRDFYLPRSLLIKPYDYQLKAYATCMQRNTLVALPTGSGKTFVAGMVMLKYKELIPTKYPVLLVNTVPLLYQHSNSIRNYFGLSVIEVCGQRNLDEASRNIRYREKDVIIATVDAFRNLLDDYNISSTLFSVAVFDEAHHIKKDHPYAKLTRKFFKTDYELNNSGSRIRIIGLTASPGEEKIRNALLSEIEANMTLPKWTESTIKRADKQIEIKSKQREFFSEQARRLVELNLPKKGLSDYEYSLLGDEMTCSRGAVVSQFLGNARKGSSKNQKEITAICEALLHLDYWGAEFARDYLEKKKASKHRSDRIEGDYEVADSPRLTALLELLKEVDKDSVTLILVDGSRSVVDALVQVLKTKMRRKILKIVGHGKRAGSIGMTWEGQAQQEEVLKEFGASEGKCNILVCTTVLEEGIDICDCDRVILFCGVARSETSFLQIVGRARKPSSTATTIHNIWEAKRYHEVINPNVERISEQLRKCHEEEKNTDFALRTNEIFYTLWERVDAFISSPPRVNETTGVFVLNHSLFSLDKRERNIISENLCSWLRFAFPTGTVTSSPLLSQVAGDSVPGISKGSSYCFLVFSILKEEGSQEELDGKKTKESPVEESLKSFSLPDYEVLQPPTKSVISLRWSPAKESKSITIFEHLMGTLWEQHLRRMEVSRSIVALLRGVLSDEGSDLCEIIQDDISYENGEQDIVTLRYPCQLGSIDTIKEKLRKNSMITLHTEQEGISMTVAGAYHQTSEVHVRLVTCNELGARVDLLAALRKNVNAEVKLSEITSHWDKSKMIMTVDVNDDTWKDIKKLQIIKEHQGQLSLTLYLKGEVIEMFPATIKQGKPEQRFQEKENTLRWLLLMRWIGDAANLFDTSPLATSDQSEREREEKENLRIEIYRKLKHLNHITDPPKLMSLLDVMKLLEKLESFKKALTNDTTNALRNIQSLSDDDGDIIACVRGERVVKSKSLKLDENAIKRISRNPLFFKKLFMWSLGEIEEPFTFEIFAAAVNVTSHTDVMHDLEELHRRIIASGVESFVSRDDYWVVIGPFQYMTFLKSGSEYVMRCISARDADVTRRENYKPEYAKISPLKDRVANKMKGWVNTIQKDKPDNQIWMYLELGTRFFCDSNETRDFHNVPTNRAGMLIPESRVKHIDSIHIPMDKWKESDEPLVAGYHVPFGNILIPYDNIDTVLSLRCSTVDTNNSSTLRHYVSIHQHTDYVRVKLVTLIDNRVLILCCVLSEECEERCADLLEIADEIRNSSACKPATKAV